jgi:CO/xanthine dehydrogenase Mo-binding subunit
MAEIRSVGIPSPRVEGEQKVAGIAVYAVDVKLGDMLCAKVLRSPMAHARIRSIDVSKAAALLGVKAILIGKDLAGAKIGKKIIDMPLLAEDVVRFAGEKVAGCRERGDRGSRTGRTIWSMNSCLRLPIAEAVGTMRR